MSYESEFQRKDKQSSSNNVAQNKSNSLSTLQLVDNRPEAVRLQCLNALADNRPSTQQARQLKSIADSRPAQMKENKIGLPDALKSGIESLSGMSMDHVKVHYNSDKPAQLRAHAYAQGDEIHLGAGQEKHLPHEAWHLVQQAQGRVRPTLQMKAGAVNDDPSLENEADMMGERAVQFEGGHVARSPVAEERAAGVVTQRFAGLLPKDSAPAQRKISVPGARVNPVGWHEAYLALIYPKVRELVVESREFESHIINELKHLDRINAKFDSADQLLDALLESLEQDEETLLESLEQDEETLLDSSEQDDVKEQEVMGGSASSITKLVGDTQIFGAPVSAESRGDYFALFRSMEEGEFVGLLDTIKKTGIPEFKFKEDKEGEESKEGEEDGEKSSHAEKMFAPNKAYVVESMSKKGKRSHLVEILVKNSARENLIYNPEYATLQGDTEVPHNRALKKGKKDNPSAITLKQESPKKKKGLTYKSVNIGFRKSGEALKLLAGYIVSIKLLANSHYNPKDPDDKRTYA